MRKESHMCGRVHVSLHPFALPQAREKTKASQNLRSPRGKKATSVVCLPGSAKRGPEGIEDCCLQSCPMPLRSVSKYNLWSRWDTLKQKNTMEGTRFDSKTVRKYP